jgi:hypothetical protein
MTATTYAMLRAAERQLQLAFDTNDAALMQDAQRRIEQLMRANNGHRPHALGPHRFTHFWRG